MRQLILTIISCSYLFADKPITAENILNLEYISQPSINVGGTRIAYVKSVPPSSQSNSRSSFREVWVTDVDGTNQRQFTSGPNNSWSPEWTPDGNLSFLSLRKEHNKFTQIYTIPTDGGEAVPLTSHSGSVSSYSWSPNGRWIAYISKDKIIFNMTI